MKSESIQKSGNVFLSRNYRLIFFGALVSELGALLYNFSAGFYILHLSGNSAFLQGLYLALCGAAMLLFTPIGGVLGDRFSKAKVMYICDWAKGGTILLATLMMLILRKADAHLIILFVLGILGNAIGGLFTPAAGAMLPYIVAPEKLQQANAYFALKNSLEGIFGIILAGILYAALPIHVLFLLVGISYLISAVSEMFIRYPFTPPSDRLTIRAVARDMGDGLFYLQTRKEILALLGAVLFINFFMAPISGNFLPYFVRTDLAGAPSYLLDQFLTPELWSSVISLSLGTGSLIGAAALSARKPPEKCGQVIAVRLCLTAIIVILLSVSYYLLADRKGSLNVFLPLLCLCCFVTGIMLSYINIPISTAMMRIVDRDKLSKVNSIASIASQGMIPIASVLAGIVLQSFGSSALLFACALGFAVSAVLLLKNRNIREL